jgi:hypothetical protein
MEAVNKPKPSATGDGWLLEYAALLLKTFFNGRPEYVWDELPMIEGWAYYQWAVNNDPLVKIFGERNSKGFVAQQVERLVDEAIKHDPRWSKD